MLSFAAIPLVNKKVYIPIEYVKFFDVHPDPYWDDEKKDVICKATQASLCKWTSTAPIFEDKEHVFFKGVHHPFALSLDKLELNRNYS